LTGLCGAGLNSVTFTPEQLEALAQAGGGSEVDLNDLALDAATIKLTKGRLDTAEDGSTVVVRGGHAYDADTDTVTVKSATPDGLLVDADGEVPIAFFTQAFRVEPLLSSCLHLRSTVHACERHA
jgi:hypothetical protein